MIRLTLLACLVGSSLIPACAQSQSGDELAGETAQDGEDGKGDAAAAFTYFVVTPDLRACSLNTVNCGGYYAERANRSTTQCGRGAAQARCYVGSIDWSGTAMPASVSKSYQDRLRNGETLIVRGTVDPGANDRPFLAATEIWVGNDTGAADGVFTIIRDNGIRCVRAPCPSLTEYRLNSSRAAQLTGIDFAPSGASQGTIDLARNGLYDTGVIVIGDRDYDSLGGKMRTANQFFTKAPVPLH